LHDIGSQSLVSKSPSSLARNKSPLRSLKSAKMILISLLALAAIAVELVASSNKVAVDVEL